MCTIKVLIVQISLLPDKRVIEKVIKNCKYVLKMQPKASYIKLNLLACFQ